MNHNRDRVWLWSKATRKVAEVELTMKKPAYQHEATCLSHYWWMWIECGLNLHRHPLIISLELDWVVTPQSRNEEAPIMHVFSDCRLDDAVQDAGASPA
jgi:hypothetical protein